MSKIGEIHIPEGADTISAVVRCRWRAAGKGRTLDTCVVAAMSDAVEADKLRADQEIRENEEHEGFFYDVIELPIFDNAEDFREGIEKAVQESIERKAQDNLRKIPKEQLEALLQAGVLKEMPESTEEAETEADAEVEQEEVA